MLISSRNTAFTCPDWQGIPVWSLPGAMMSLSSQKRAGPYLIIQKKVLKDADLVYAVSHDIQGHIIRDFGISESKIRYFPFGIDTDLFSPPLPGQTPLRETIEVFSNRGFFPVYDNETLVRGFARAYTRDSRLRLILKGEGHEEQKIRDLIVNLGLPAEIVTFQKKTVYSQVPNDYRQADIFITTSQSDGTPVSVLEAMASGNSLHCNSSWGYS